MRQDVMDAALQIRDKCLRRRIEAKENKAITKAYMAITSELNKCECFEMTSHGANVIYKAIEEAVISASSDGFMSGVEIGHIVTNYDIQLKNIMKRRRKNEASIKF